MEIAINGEARQLPEGMTVAQLLDQLQIQPERIVVEVNLTILKRAQHAGTILHAGDRVEIVHFVGGGAAGRRLSSPALPSATGRITRALRHRLAADRSVAGPAERDQR